MLDKIRQPHCDNPQNALHQHQQIIALHTDIFGDSLGRRQGDPDDQEDHRQDHRDEDKVIDK